MTHRKPESIHRNQDGSIDTGYYQAQGQLTRSQSAHHLLARLKSGISKAFSGATPEQLDQKRCRKFHVIYPSKVQDNTEQDRGEISSFPAAPKRLGSPHPV